MDVPIYAAKLMQHFSLCASRVAYERCDIQHILYRYRPSCCWCCLLIGALFNIVHFCFGGNLTCFFLVWYCYTDQSIIRELHLAIAKSPKTNFCLFLTKAPVIKRVGSWNRTFVKYNENPTRVPVLTSLRHPWDVTTTPYKTFYWLAV